MFSVEQNLIDSCKDSNFNHVTILGDGKQGLMIAEVTGRKLLSQNNLRQPLMRANRDWMFLNPATFLKCEIHRDRVKNLSLLMTWLKNDGSESFRLKSSQLFASLP